MADQVGQHRLDPGLGAGLARGPDEEPEVEAPDLGHAASPPRSLRSSALAGLRCSLAVGSVTPPRLRARSAPRPWRACDAPPLSARSRRLASALAPLLGPGGPAMLTRCRLGHAASPPRSLRSSALAGLRCSLAVGSIMPPRLRARSAPRPWRACDAHSLSARSCRLASALAPLLGPGGPAMLTRCRLGHHASPPRSLRSSAPAGLRCSLAVGSVTTPRLRARSAPRPRRACDAHSLSARSRGRPLR